MPTPKPSTIETPVDPRTGDKATATPGHVTPGKDLRARLGLAPTEVSKTDADRAKEAKAAEEKAKADATAKPKVVPVRKHVRTIPPKPAAQISPKEIAEIAAEVVKAGKAAEPATATAPAAPELTPKQKRDHAVLAHLEKTNPAYKGKAEQYLNSQKKFADYKKAWQSDHAGQEFNAGDAEHEEFIKANEVTFDQDDYLEALTDLKAEEKAAAAVKPITDKFTREEEQRKLDARVAELVPKIVTHQRATALTFFGQLGDEFMGVLNEGGVYQPEEGTKLVAAKPVARKVFALAQQAESFAGEIARIATGIASFNEKNPLDVEIFQFAGRQEAEMLKLPEDQRINADGKLFITAAQFDKLPKSERGDYWTLSDTDLSALYAVEKAAEAKRLIEEDDKEFNARLEAAGYTKAPVTQMEHLQQRRETTKPPIPELQQPVEERSPAGAIAPRMAPARQAVNTPKSPLLQRILG